MNFSEMELRMEIDDFTQFKMKTMLAIWNCGDLPDSTSMAELMKSFKNDAKQSFGMDEAESIPLFANLVEESVKLRRETEQAEAKAAKQTEEKKVEQRKDLIISRWALVFIVVTGIIYFLVSYRAGMGFWNWLLDRGWLIVALIPLYALYYWVVMKIYEFTQFNKSIDTMRAQIQENEQWVWHCQRCGASFAYNGESDAICGNCRNRLTKVRGMRI
jgi:hypothetical protein